MSTKTICTCDRCGKPFEYRLSKWAGYFAQGIKKENRICFRKLYHGNQDGYSGVDYNYDMCAECTEKLMEFLRNPEAEKEKEK